MAKWPELRRRLEGAGFTIDERPTRAPGDATTIARDTLREGADTIIAVGGDGTIHEVANGFVEGGAPIRSDARLGILPCGSGSDFIRTLGLPADAAGAIERLAHGASEPIDLGKATYSSPSGSRESRYYVNSASVGLSGAVLATLATYPEAFSNSIGYMLASVSTMATYRPERMAVTADDTEYPTEPLMMAVVGNGRYFGGGMHVLPRAKLDDGLLDVLLLRDRPFWELLVHFPRLYAGTHLDLDMVRWSPAKRARIEGTGLVEIDGEQPGRGPVDFEILPGAIRIIR